MKTDRGQLSLDARGDLDRLVVTEDGYSSVVREQRVLYALTNEAGELHFSRSQNGNGSPGTQSVLVNYRD